MFWQDKRVVVTGGAGFLGRHLVARLAAENPADIFIPRSAQYNLVDNEAVKQLYTDRKPDIVIHAAGVVGGIGANKENPGRFFYENLMMGVQLLEQARVNKIEKVVNVGTICAYPKYTPVPFKEEELWNGYPEETNAPYGIAKKALLVQGQAYRQQYGFNSIYLLPVNMYGPGDNFNPNTSHVIPALIKKCLEATNEIEVWGTGKATREFLYAPDCADAIILAAEHYNKSEPVNIGVGGEISIKDLVTLIAELTGFNGTVKWLTDKPDGQPRRCLDTTRAEAEFGFKAKTDFKEGLRRTIDWYKQSINKA